MVWTDRTIGIAGLVLGTVGTFLTLLAFALTKEQREGIVRITRISWRYLLLGSAVLGVFGVLMWVHETFHKQTWLPSFLAVSLLLVCYAAWSIWALSRRIPYCKGDACRWENFSKIVYGHIEYEPLLKHGLGMTPAGFGKDLLDELLASRPNGAGITLEKEGKWRRWHNVLDGLLEDKCHIVATPLFATFDRSKKVRFTAPLFFSNIGLYMRKGVALSHKWSNLTLPGMMEALEKSPDSVNFFYVKGEISEKLAVKYTQQGVSKTEIQTEVLTTVFEKIEAETDKPFAVFFESYSAENYKREQSKIRDNSDDNDLIFNVLKLHEILYPVCFAVRMGDYQLANMVNLQLLDYTKRKGGAIHLLTQKIIDDKVNNHLLDTEVSDHFVSEWPFSGANGGDVHHA